MCEEKKKDGRDGVSFSYSRVDEKLIRRFIEKGVDIGKFSKKRIKEIEKFMNDHPRKMFGGLSSNEVYKSLEKN